MATTSQSSPSKSPTNPGAPKQRYKELLIAREPARVALRLPWLVRLPSGDGRPLLTLPGFGASDSSMLPVRRFLTHKGHRTFGWGLGRNGGDVQALLDRSLPIAERLRADAGRPINLVGWSLGGVIAREIARDRPDLVHRVATFGTPLTGPRSTAAARAYSPLQMLEIEEAIAERSNRPILRPVLAIHSRNDGVVDWRTCIDEESVNVKNRRVSSSHVGMGIDPDVWSHLAKWFAPSPAD